MDGLNLQRLITALIMHLPLGLALAGAGLVVLGRSGVAAVWRYMTTTGCDVVVASRRVLEIEVLPQSERVGDKVLSVQDLVGLHVWKGYEAF